MTSLALIYTKDHQKAEAIEILGKIVKNFCFLFLKTCKRRYVERLKGLKSKTRPRPSGYQLDHKRPTEGPISVIPRLTWGKGFFQKCSQPTSTVFPLQSASEELYRVKKIVRKIQRCLQNAVGPQRPIYVCTCKVSPNLKFSICILMSLS